MNTMLTKFVDLPQLMYWRTYLKENQMKLVVCSGCFDLLHVGHIHYLEHARSMGDALLVGVNGDDAVRQLKGEGRPINCAYDRAHVLCALECVSKVCIFPDIKATSFLRMAKPDVWVKGAPWSLETLDKEEKRTVLDAGGTILFAPTMPVSTTAIVMKIRDNYPGRV